MGYSSLFHVYPCSLDVSTYLSSPRFVPSHLYAQDLSRPTRALPSLDNAHYPRGTPHTPTGTTSTVEEQEEADEEDQTSVTTPRAFHAWGTPATTSKGADLRPVHRRTSRSRRRRDTVRVRNGVVVPGGGSSGGGGSGTGDDTTRTVVMELPVIPSGSNPRGGYQSRGETTSSTIKADEKQVQQRALVGFSALRQMLKVCVVC